MPLSRHLKTAIVLLLTAGSLPAFAGSQLTIPSKARITDNLAFSSPGAPACTFTSAASNPIVVATSAEDPADGGSDPVISVTLALTATSGPVLSGTVTEQLLNIPNDVPANSTDPATGMGDVCCPAAGCPNPYTVSFSNGPVTTIDNIGPGFTSKSYAVTITSGAISFVATLVGPGGTNTCSVSRSLVCASVQTEDIGYWDDPGGNYVDFSPGSGAWFVINNDPPNCTFSLCQTDGLGSPIPGCCGLRGYHPGCFAPDTMILLSDGRTKPAARIDSGDELWSPVRERGIKVKRLIVGPEKLRLIELGYGRTRVRVTTKHPMPTPGGLKPASAITFADSLLGEDGAYHRVTRIREMPLNPEQIVYNFELDTFSPNVEDHLVVADGIVTGDYTLQDELQKHHLP